MSAQQVYRIIDVQTEESRAICYLYTRSSNGERRVFELPIIFEIIIGSDNGEEELLSYKDEIEEKYKDRITLENKGRSLTYRRGSAYLFSVLCDSFRTYSSLLSYTKYGNKQKKERKIFICNFYENLEDHVLHRYELYGVLYIKENPKTKKLVPADQGEQFNYVPKVASFDFEMLSLNVVNPESEPYIASYFLDGKNYIIYSSNYISDKLEDTEDYKYIKVHDNFRVVVTLLKLILATQPDVLLGYNIYFADIPIMYYTLGRRLYSISDGHKLPIYFHTTKKLDKKYTESEQGTNLRIPGTSTIDMYIYLTKMLPSDKQDNLKLGHVGQIYLHASKDPLSYGDLARIHARGTKAEKLDVIKYCAKDSRLVHDLYEYFNVWNFHSAMTSLCGVSSQRMMSRGNVEIVYGLCDRVSREMRMYMDSPNAKIFRPGGGLVLSPKLGFYEKVICIDLGSLYPNIVIQHNIDAATFIDGYITELPNMRMAKITDNMYYERIESLDIDLLRDSRNVIHGFYKNKKGVLPEALLRLLKMRDELKIQIREAKDRGDTDAVKKLSGDEQAKKITANSTCGALAEQTEGNPMSFCLLNDIITTTGRTIISSVNQLLSDREDVKVIYGDTDSLFLKCRDDPNRLLDFIHKHLPIRIKFKVEYVADKFLIGGKKHYIVQIGKDVKVTGYKSAKSSPCEAVRSTFQKFVTSLFDHGVDEALESYLREVRYYDALIDESAEDLQDEIISKFSFKFMYRGKNYYPKSHVAQTRDAMKMRKVELIPGNSLEVAIVKTRYEYLRKYQEEPPIELPEDNKKSDVLYTTDEISRHCRLINVGATFRSQCLGDIQAITSAYRSTADYL